jgi:bifunctional DNA-binding transcriptional regulator/antitoxin component of YhaV-PrlF toxin-antitoxin module
VTITVKDNAGLIVPLSVQRRAGIRSGDRLEFKVSRGVITIVPSLPNSGGEYTPKQRRVIDSQLDQAEKGHFRGPFSTADEMIADMKRQLRSRAALGKAKRSR